MIDNAKRINQRIHQISILIAGSSSHIPKHHTMNQLRRLSQNKLCLIIMKQQGDLKASNEKLLNLRWELRTLLRELRNLLKKN